MPGFVRGNFSLLLQREPNIVETFEQTMTREVVNLEGRCKASVVSNSEDFQINCQPVIRNFSSPARNLLDLLIFQDDSQDAVLKTIIGEDVGERRRNHHAEAVVCECPDSMFAR